jgi:hypothetical protein
MQESEQKIVTPLAMELAIAVIRVWESGDMGDLPCPICDTCGLEIVDKSARPHMLWYALTCSECGLDEAVAIPENAYAQPHP